MAQVSTRDDPDPVEKTRVSGLGADLAAIVTRVDLLAGTRLPFNQESVAFFGLAPGPVHDAHLETIRSQIATIVGGQGTLVDRYAAFAARFVVPPDRLRPAFEAAAKRKVKIITFSFCALDEQPGKVYSYGLDEKDLEV